MDRTTIESWSTELWMALFEYFDVLELYNQFNGLNSRIDHIIQLTNNLCLKIDKTNHIQYLENIMPWIRCENVQSLTFSDDSKKYPETEFFLLYPLEKFTQLQSFIFQGWSLPFHNPREVIEQLPNLTQLQKLDVELHEFPQDNYEDNNTRLMELIFNSSDNLRKSLKHVVMNMYIGERTLPLVTFLPTNIEYFQANVIDLEPFLELIPSLVPCCKTIKFNYLEVNNGEEVMSSSLNVLNCCTKLTLKTNCYFKSHHFEVLLRHFPEVKRLFIDNISADDQLTTEELEVLIRDHWPKLLQFELISRNYLYGDDHIWKEFSQPKFWSKGNVGSINYRTGWKLQFDRSIDNFIDSSSDDE
ncbi:unnamed protein product [Adineta ricciae]|uniref:Uncharacterized protein n=1 Tax=Adineta ricciae TaxID=249248 RepID=A0A815N9B2_ADIRI|nr:unnamed protein product [Adineta ricciae]CAF1426518.1 unnamed protein product [Adineta ricciae]